MNDLFESISIYSKNEDREMSQKIFYTFLLIEFVLYSQWGVHVQNFCSIFSIDDEKSKRRKKNLETSSTSIYPFNKSCILMNHHS